MPKQVKEFILEETTGQVSIEYADNTTSTYNASDSLVLSEGGLTKSGAALTAAEMQSLQLGAGIVISEDAPVDADGRPNGTIYIQVGA